MEETHEKKEHMQEPGDEKQHILSYPPSESQSYPWLVICDGKNKERQTFFSISKDYFHTRTIPEMRNKQIYASSDGWLVLKDIDSKNLCLLNPTSKEMIQLPPLEDIGDNFICILTATPSNPNPNHQCHVLFIDQLTCTFYFCQFRDEKFDKQVFETNRPMYIENATFHGGKIYCLICYEELASILYIAEFVGREICFTKSTIEELHVPLPGDICCFRNFFIESCGELLLVNQMFFGLYKKKVYGFLIFRMDSSKHVWVRVKNIGEHTIFVSEGSGISCFVPEKGVKRNSIYFTKTSSRFLYVFDLEDDTISKSLPCPTVACHGLNLEWVMLP